MDLNDSSISDSLTISLVLEWMILRPFFFSDSLRLILLEL